MGRRIDRIAAPKNAEDKSPLANLVHEGLDRLSQGIAIFDSELRLVLANQRLVDMFGTPPELVEPGTPFADMIRFNAERGDYGPGEVEELVRERVERARSFEPHLFERVRADGTAIEVRGEPLPGGGFVSTFTDITERKLAEEVLRKDRERIEVDVFERTSDLTQTIDELRQTESALLESEERYRDLVENDTALIIRFLPDTTNTFANEAYARNRNTTLEDLIGRKFIDGLPDEEKDTYPAYLNTFTAEHPVKTREMRIVRPDGSFGWLSWSIRAFHDDQGNITEFQSAGVDASDQKHAEQALKESEEKFRAAFESAAVGMAMVGNDGGWLMVNRAFCEMVGYSEKELRARSWLDVTHPEDVENSHHTFERMLAGDADTGHYEKRYIHKDGHIVWAEVSVSMVRGAESARLYTIGHMQDISDRKHAEEALRVSEERYALAVGGAHDALWDWDIEKGVIYTSPRMSEILDIRLPKDMWTAGEFYRYVHPDDVERFKRETKAHLRGESEYFECEFRVAGNDENPRWVLQRGLARRDSSGRAYRMAGSTKDITDRKRTEDALKESEERLRAVIDNVIDGIITIDEQGTIESFSPSAERMFGCSAKEAVGKNVAILMPEPDNSKHDGYLEAFRRTGKANIIGTGR